MHLKDFPTNNHE